MEKRKQKKKEEDKQGASPTQIAMTLHLVAQELIRSHHTLWDRVLTFYDDSVGLIQNRELKLKLYIQTGLWRIDFSVNDGTRKIKPTTQRSGRKFSLPIALGRKQNKTKILVRSSNSRPKWVWHPNPHYLCSMEIPTNF